MTKIVSVWVLVLALPVAAGARGSAEPHGTVPDTNARLKFGSADLNGPDLT